MERELASHAISHHLEPLGPRDDHKIKFDPDGVRWQQGSTTRLSKLRRIIADSVDAPSATRRSVAISPL
jgi:hypothetical protein